VYLLALARAAPTCINVRTRYLVSTSVRQLRSSRTTPPFLRPAAPCPLYCPSCRSSCSTAFSPRGGGWRSMDWLRRQACGWGLGRGLTTGGGEGAPSRVRSSAGRGRQGGSRRGSARAMASPTLPGVDVELLPPWTAHSVTPTAQPSARLYRLLSFPRKSPPCKYAHACKASTVAKPQNAHSLTYKPARSPPSPQASCTAHSASGASRP